MDICLMFMFHWITILEDREDLLTFNILVSHIGPAGVSLELSDREKVCDIFRISGRSFGPTSGFPYMFYTFTLLPKLSLGISRAVYKDFFSQIAPLGWFMVLSNFCWHFGVPHYLKLQNLKFTILYIWRSPEVNQWNWYYGYLIMIKGNTVFSS